MYEINGICYAGTDNEMMTIVSVKTLEDMMMLITFQSGETRLFDATILNGPVFEPLKDSRVFANVIIDHGVVTWMDGDIDCSPEYMYENSYKYDTCEGKIA